MIKGENPDTERDPAHVRHGGNILLYGNATWLGASIVDLYFTGGQNYSSVVEGVFLTSLLGLSVMLKDKVEDVFQPIADLTDDDDEFLRDLRREWGDDIEDEEATDDTPPAFLHITQRDSRGNVIDRQKLE